ncbi:MAG: sulfotransferase [Rhodospirillales bacterium]
MAVGYAMYKTLFNQGYPFSYDLADLARYIAAYLRLMSHWQALLGDRLITLRYETLVSDQEAETRRLLAACGLSLEPRLPRPRSQRVTQHHPKRRPSPSPDLPPAPSTSSATTPRNCNHS